MCGSKYGASSTLQTTSLLHEAWLRLDPGTSAPWEDETHFIRIAARAMRQVLVGDGAACDFATTVVELYRQPQRAVELGKQAARYATRLDWHSVVERFATLLRDTAEGMPYAPPVRT